MYSLRMLFNLLSVFLVESRKFIGPAGLLAAYRFLIDSRVPRLTAASTV